MEYTLAESTSIRDVAQMQRDIANLLTQGGDLVVDIGRVKQIDTTVVQLLAVVNEQLIRNKDNLRWKNTSSAFTAALTILGLQGLILNSQAT